jgi:hypothetical protein
MPPAFEAFRTPSQKHEQGYKTDNDMAMYSYAINMPEIRNNPYGGMRLNGTDQWHIVREM